jgi:lipoprotein-releasing system permease protein
MTLPYELWIALRHLRARRRELFISLTTWISVGGVALGVAALTVVLSVMTGFEADLREKILGTHAHVVVSADPGNIRDPGAVMAAVEALPEVRGATPFVHRQVLLMADTASRGAVFRGVDPASAARATDLGKFLISGRLGDLEGEVPGLLVGREMARNMGLFVGDRVRVVSPDGNPTPVGLMPRLRSFRVAGIFASGLYEYDTGYVFAALPAAREFLRMDGVSGVEVRLEDLFRARRVAAEIRGALGPGYRVRDWMELNRSLFGALALEKTAMFVILALIVVVAAFNIASALIMVVLEKSRDIGVLKAMGASNRSIRRVFVFEGCVIGALGTAVGTGGGWLLCELLKRYKFIELPSDVYYIDTLPVVMQPELFVAVGGCAVLLCYLATLYPSWQASRLDPIETLRYE